MRYRGRDLVRSRAGAFDDAPAAVSGPAVSARHPSPRGCGSGRRAPRKQMKVKQRVRSGILSAELQWPGSRITVNLAPAELKKEGSGFDLPIALSLLAASRQVP